MKTNKTRRRNRRGPAAARRRTVITVALVLSLVAAGGALAQWSGIVSIGQKNTKKSGEVTIQNFSPELPSKEYVYAGGKLVATEEPGPPTGTNNSAFVSQSPPPSAMTPGQTAPVTVTMSNTGTTTWASGTYFLGSLNPQGNTNWGLSQVSLPTSTAPAAQATFNFTVTAPSTGGTYNFQWQMQQNGVGYFGEPTTNVVVTVSGGSTNNAAFVSQVPPPSTMTTGQMASVSVTMSNTGTTTWSPGTFFLGSLNPQGNVNWSLSQVSLSSSTGPGAQATFNFTVTAPSSAGTYNFQWGMLQSGVGYFGTPSTNVSVTVAANPCSGGSACPAVTTFSGSTTGIAGYKEGSATVARWRAPVDGVVGKDPLLGQQTLYVADTDNHCIRKINLSDQISGLVAGTPQSAGYFEADNGSPTVAKYNHPRGITAIKDANGVITTLLIADTDNHVIRKLQWTTNQWVSSTLSGTPGEAGLRDGDATTSIYNAPQGITYASDGFIYVADTENLAVRKVDLTGNSTTVIPQGTIYRPAGISAREGNGSSPLLYISGQQDHNIWRWDPAGGVVLLAGSGTPFFADGVGTAASFNSPGHLVWACTASGEVLYIADRNNHRIRKLVISSSTVSTYAGFKKGFVNGACTVAWFFLPSGVAGGPGGEAYVMDSTNNVIRKAL